MHPVLFYGVPQGCSFGSIVALEWLQQPYQLCRIDMLDYPWDRQFGRVNPLYQTPALLTADDQPLSESLAILLHLASRADGSPLGPRQGTPAFDQLNRWLAYLVSDFFSAFSPLWLLYEKDDLSEEQRAVLRRVGREKVEEVCRYLDGHLAAHAWLLGEQPSLADAYLAGLARWVDYHRLFDLSTEHPHLACYLDRLASDPAVRFATAIEQGTEADGCGAFQGHVSLAQLDRRLPAAR